MRGCSALGLLLAACSSIPTGQPDHLITRVTRAGVAVQNAIVIYHDGAGNPLDESTTDDTGAVDRITEDDGMVTVVDPADSGHLTTVLHVGVPGTIAVLLGPLGANVLPDPVMVELAAPASPAPSGTTFYTLDLACTQVGTETLPATLAIDPMCSGPRPFVLAADRQQPGSFDVLALATGTAVVGSEGLTLAPSAWTRTCAPVAVAYDSDVVFRLAPRFAGVAFTYASADFCPSSRPQPGVPGVVPIADLGDGMVATTYRWSETGELTATTVHGFPTVPATFAPDDELITGTAEFLVLGPAGASWIAGGGLIAADLVEARLEWLGRTNHLVWDVIAPANTSSVQLPDLPPSLYPPEIDSPTRALELDYYSTTWLGGYTRAITALPALMDATQSPVDGATRRYTAVFRPDQP